jgi:hypothetical protein
VPIPVIEPPLTGLTSDDIYTFAGAAVEVLKDATLPTSSDELVGIVVGESVAGFCGGLASRGVAFLIGDTKKDPALLKGIDSATYFASRAATISIGRLAGLPRPVADFLGDVVGALVFESTKLIGRIEFNISNPALDISEPPTISVQKLAENARQKGNLLSTPRSRMETKIQMQPQGQVLERRSTSGKQAFRRKTMASLSDSSSVTTAKDYVTVPDLSVWGTNMRPTPISNTSSNVTFLTWQEILQDVTKWVTYDLLLPDDPEDAVLGAAEYGAVSGLFGNLVYEILPKKGKIMTPKDVTIRFVRAALEGAALFSSYEESVELFQDNKLALPPEVVAFFKKKWF